MRQIGSKPVQIVLAVFISAVVIFGAVKGIQSLFFQPSICELNNESLPSIANDGDVKSVASALRQRAEILSKNYDTNSKEESEALKALADGFNRLATELDNADATWSIDTLVSELANDSTLNSANLTLEGALKQCK
jgi:hypothetical protein